MKQLIEASQKDRELLFRDVGLKLNIPFSMIEKDFWVCFVLNCIFSNDELCQAFRFKGGTSLSKGYGLIKRFSEDLDLVLDKTLILGNEDIFKSSNSQQKIFAEIVDKKASDYISTTIKTKIKDVLNDFVKIYTDEEYCEVNPKYQPKNIDNKLLHIVYPKSNKNEYLRPDILLEIGIMSARTPFENKQITPYILDAFPNLDIRAINVPTVMPKRTFWDKATILHREHYRSEKTKTPERYSRHYYDLFQMGHSFVKELALQDKSLLADVVNRKDKLYHCPWARYEDCLVGKFKLLPNENNVEHIERDYSAMQQMIFSEQKIEWQKIIDYLSLLECEINSNITLNLQT